MVILTDVLRKYLKGETRKNYTKDTQYSYDSKIRRRARIGMDDLILVAERMPSKWRDEIFARDKLKKFLQKVLTPKEENYNEYVNDIWAYETVIRLLQVIHGALNNILNSQKIGDMKRLNPAITRGYYTNIAALEMMFIAFPGKMREKG